MLFSYFVNKNRFAVANAKAAYVFLYKFPIYDIHFKVVHLCSVTNTDELLKTTQNYLYIYIYMPAGIYIYIYACRHTQPS